MKDFAIVVSGLPGSGKTSIAKPLAQKLRLPLLSKDMIKESLFASDNQLPQGDLGMRAIELMYEKARQPSSVILDSFFWHGKAESDLEALDKALIQIHCSCPISTTRVRYETRIHSEARHEVHQLIDPDWAEYAEHNSPLSLAGPLLIVDTETEFDHQIIIDFVSEAIDSLQAN